MRPGSIGKRGGEATEYRAKLEVSKLLGHGRADVTDVYLACEKPENQ